MSVIGKSILSTFVFRYKTHSSLLSVINKLVCVSDNNLLRGVHCSCKKKSQQNRRIMASALGDTSTVVKEQKFDYFLILDFEATCRKNEQIIPQEIIELPVLKINSKTLETEAIFHQYVQPRVHSQLSGFCTESYHDGVYLRQYSECCHTGVSCRRHMLTGIIQDMVDGQPHIEETLKNFEKWMQEQNLLDPNVKSLFVTCGDWDLMKMLPNQCNYFNIPIPDYFTRWLNIKKAFATVTSQYPKGMMPMLQKLNIPHQGRHHSGIDDCKNIGNILCELLRRGYVAEVSGSRKG